MTVVACLENSVQYVPPDGFFGIQSVQNSDHLVSSGGGIPPHSPPTSTPSAYRCRGLGRFPTFEPWLRSCHHVGDNWYIQVPYCQITQLHSI